MNCRGFRPKQTAAARQRHRGNQLVTSNKQNQRRSFARDTQIGSPNSGGRQPGQNCVIVDMVLPHLAIQPLFHFLEAF